MLARAPASLRSQVPRLRISSPARYAHGHYHHFPFALPGKNPGVFAVKLSVFLLTGFAIPFVASAIQLRRSGGAA